MSKTNVTVKLIGESGNAFAIMGKVLQEMKRAGVSKEIQDAYKNEARSGDYDNLLRVTMDYVEVE